jgi:hypothetical protein
LLTNQAEAVKEAYRQVGFNTLGEGVIVDWTTLILENPAS